MKRLAILVAVLAFLILFVLRWLTGAGPSPAMSEATPLLHGPVFVLDSLRASGAVESHRLRTGASTTAWLTLVNTGTEPIPEIRVTSFGGSGLTPFGPCWQGTLPICGSGIQPQRSASGQGFRLEADSQLTLWGEFDVNTTPSRDAGLVATLVWEAPDSSAAQQPRQLTLDVLLPRLNVAPGWKIHLSTFSDALYQFAKDFALPILAVLLGFLFQRSRELAKQAKEDQIAKDAQIHETWNQLLPRIHENAQRYYMPLWSAGANFLDEYSRYKDQTYLHSTQPADLVDRRDPPAEDRLQKMFFHLVMFYAHMRALGKEVGGFYFKSRKGEDILALLWDIFRERLRGYIPYEKMEALANGVDPRESIDHFLQRGRWSPTRPPSEPTTTPSTASSVVRPSLRDEFRAVQDGFKKWLTLSPSTELEEHVSVLSAFCKILAYEMNFPYALWYEDQDERPLPAECAATIRRLTTWDEDIPGTLSELKETAEKYFGR